MGNDKEYEYRDMLATTWDLLRGDMLDSPDRQFCRDFVENNGQPALDVGCGTGRLLLEFLADGIQIDGVDVSPEMVDLCRQKAADQSLSPNLYVQAIETLALPTKYRSIIVPSYSFQLITDLQDARRTLSRFYEHFLPGGKLLITIWHSKREGPAEWGDWYFVAEKERVEDGTSVKRQERSMYDPETQLRHTENRYELIKNGQVVYTEDHRRSPELRNYSLAQIRQMLAEAGFTEVEAVSGYSSDPATEDDGYFCIIGKRKRGN
jgi:ubiquinone/menaquinone biosynthesis C-methylase UbiE